MIPSRQKLGTILGNESMNFELSKNVNSQFLHDLGALASCLGIHKIQKNPSIQFCSFVWKPKFKPKTSISFSFNNTTSIIIVKQILLSR